MPAIYKGQGKDPLDMNSYRGVTLTPILAKVLERLFLNRLEPLLWEKSIPHNNQTGFVKKASCSEAIFSSYEMLSKYAPAGDIAYIIMFY